MQIKPHVVMVVRDVGPANHLAPIAREIRLRDEWDLCAYVQGPAAQVFKDASVDAQLVDLPSAAPGTPDAIALFNKAANILYHNPQLVIVGNSSTMDTIGIDEAVVKNVKNNIPIAFLQDWPGNISSYADSENPQHHYLCTSPSGRDLTRLEGFDDRAHLIGSAAYDSYKDKDFLALRAGFREELVARVPHAANKKIVVFSGQYLTEHPGYLDLIDTLAFEAAKYPDVHLVYRPHPRERIREKEGIQPDVFLTKTTFDNHLHGRWSEDWNAAPFASMAGADILAGYCSTSMYDLAIANAHSPKPLGVPLAMMWDKALNAALNVNEYPWFEGPGGLGIIVKDKSQLEETLFNALESNLKDWTWRGARKSGIQNNEPAAKTAVNILTHLLP